MKTFLASAVVLALAGCAEPPRTGQMDMLVCGLAHLHQWDPVMQARGHSAYEAVMGFGKDILPVMAAHLTDDTPTAIHEDLSDRTANVSDVVFLMMLQLTKRKWQDFAAEGVFVSTALPNPVFCVKWTREAKFKVQAKFLQILEEDQN